MTLQHDPNTKQRIKNALYDFLYQPVKQRFQARLIQIIQHNQSLLGHSHPSFTYKGIPYSASDTAAPRKANRLALQLHPDMEDYLAELHRLNAEEIPYVLGYINQVLNASNNFPDYLHLLPEAVHAPVYQMLVTCPCNSRQLSNVEIDALRIKNEASIALIKQRMVMNLIAV